MSDGFVIPDWSAPKNVRAVVTTRTLPGASKPPFDRFNLGARSGDEPAAVTANRATLVEALGLPEAPRWTKQVHAAAVHDADAILADAEPEADASVTHQTERVLAVLTADCLPVFLASDDGTAVGVAHAGWRGLAGGVIEATIATLGVEPESLFAWLGPAIGPKSYEVGDEVRDAFVRADADAVAAFTPTRAGHWFCDLYALARQRLTREGVTRISGGDFDTFTDTRFYSYRRDRETGRFASVIWIEPATVRVDDADTVSNVDAGDELQPVFARVLGDAFARLPPRVRALHSAAGLRRYRGRAEVRRGGGWLSRLCGWATRLPHASSETPIDVEIDASADEETWTRRFGTQPMRSHLRQHGALLRERLGLATFEFALSAADGVLRWEPRRVSALGLPLPTRWFRGVRATESQRDGRYRFEVEAALPWIGELVRYEGWLEAVDE
jgi:YfiH family protein